MTRVSLFRYAVARQLIHAGLRLMPDGHYKRELLTAMWALRERVDAALAATHREGARKRPELQALIDKAGDWWRAATPEEKDAMLKAQQKSWVRGEKGSAETYSLRRPASEQKNNEKDLDLNACIDAALAEKPNDDQA